MIHYLSGLKIFSFCFIVLIFLQIPFLAVNEWMEKSKHWMIIQMLKRKGQICNIYTYMLKWNKIVESSRHQDIDQWCIKRVYIWSMVSRKECIAGLFCVGGNEAWSEIIRMIMFFASKEWSRTRQHSPQLFVTHLIHRDRERERERETTVCV